MKVPPHLSDHLLTYKNTFFNPFALEAVYTRNFFSDRLSDSVQTRIPFFESFSGSRVNTPLVAVTNVG